MDKGILIEYADMKEEIKDLRRRIEKIQKELDKLHGQIVVDSVSCGKKGKKPLGTVKITGRPVGVISRKEQLLNKRTRRLEELEEELLEMTIQVEEYIESIEKSELRIIFRLYFLDDLSYPKVADALGSKYNKYMPNQNTTQQFPHPQPQPSGNRQQRRNYQKQYGKGKYSNTGR